MHPALNIPNQLTFLRLILSIVLFVLIGFKQFAAGALLFVFAASTDWIDGYLARKYGWVTVLGRILDPFVDKVIICGAFIFLVAEPESRVAAWMAVVVVGRELLVTALRSALEGQGTDFSAQMQGKIKMVLQCVAVAASLAHLHFTTRDGGGSQLAGQLVTLVVWAAIIITITSGLEYVLAAVRLFRSPQNS